ncbi:uncharacterized protein [Asterias amurensis]|uniref:uncharacterized protein n=1 Tax=Asterias amurensis TaxID=7602 RepID=UPI003AB715E7
MDVVDAHGEGLSAFHHKLTAKILQDEVLGNLRPMFPHLGENTIRDIVAHQSALLNQTLDQVSLTNSCVDVLLDTRAIQQENSPIPRDYIDLTQFEDSSGVVKLNFANNTLDDTPAGNVSIVDLITDESSMNSTNNPSLNSVSSNSPNALISEPSPKRTNISDISIESVSGDLQQSPKDGCLISPNAISTPVRFQPATFKTTPIGGRNAKTPNMRSPDDHYDGQHHRAKSSKAPSTMSRCPCDDCKMNPSSHGHHHSSSSQNGGRERHHSSPEVGGHSSPSIFTSTHASSSIGSESKPPLQSSGTSHLGSGISTSASMHSTTTGNTRVISGTSTAETPTDSKRPPVRIPSPEGDLMKARLNSLNEAISKLSKMSKNPRKIQPRLGISSPVTSTSVPVTGNTTAKPGFQKASTFASNQVNKQAETAQVNSNSNNVSIYNKQDVDKSGTLNPGTASTISPTNPGLIREKPSCRYPTSSSTTGPLPSTPNSLSSTGIHRMYKSPSSTSFPIQNQSASQLRPSFEQPRFPLKQPIKFGQMASVGAPASNQNLGIHHRYHQGQTAFATPVSTNSQSLSKPATVGSRLDSEPRTTVPSVRTFHKPATGGQVNRQKTSPNQAPLDRPDSGPRSTAPSVRPASASTSVYNASEPIPTVKLPPATSSHPSPGLKAQQQHYARAHTSSSATKEQEPSSSQTPASRYVPQPQVLNTWPNRTPELIMPKPPVKAQSAMTQQQQWQPSFPAQAQPTATVPLPLDQASPAMVHQLGFQVPPAMTRPTMEHQLQVQAPPAQPAVVHQPPTRPQAPPAMVQPAMERQPPAQALAPPAQPAMVHQPPTRPQAPPVMVQPAMEHQPPPAPAQPLPAQAQPEPAQVQPPPAQPARIHQAPPAQVQAPPVPVQPAMVHQPPAMVDQPQIPVTVHNFDMMAAEVMTMFPDVEPGYVLTKLREFQDHPTPNHLMCNHLLEDANYPKVQKPDVHKTPSTNEKKSKGRGDYIKDYYKLKTLTPYQDVMFHLQTVFTMLSLDSIRHVLSLHFHHYAPTRVCLEEILLTNEAIRNILKRPKNITNDQRKVKVNITTKDREGKPVQNHITIQVLKGRRNVGSGRVADRDLQKEIEYYKEYTKNSAVEKDLMFAISMNENEYETEGQLIECGCCYAEVPFENMVQCLDGHLFCSTCLQSYAQQAVYGQGKALLMCMTDGCDSSYPRVQLEKCLKSKDLVKYDERVQEECIQLADIEGFVKCPSCDFGALLDPGDKVFKCQKSGCMKESCRLCGGDWAEHFGKRCEEIEQKNETSLRLSYEERMSQAQIRTCNRCKTGIMKDQGCNKMTCRCGSKMCYICRQPNIDYSHFCAHVRNPGEGCTKCVKCSLWTDPVEDDKRAVEELEKELQIEKGKMNQAKESRDLSTPIDLDGPEAKRQRVV